MKNLKVKYNRVSTLQQSGNRFEADKEKYDFVFFDKISGTVKFQDRPKAQELIKLINEGKVSEICLEDLSRCGRNTGDVIATLEWFEEREINVHVRSIGLQSRPNGQPNKIFQLITSILSSISTLDLESIKERTRIGREIYIQNGGYIGRPTNSIESESKFISKPKNQKCLEYLKKGRTLREISKILSMSTSTIQKVKKVGIKRNLILS